MPTRMPRWSAILLVSLAGLLLEVGYTRIVSFKLWYYYTYLVIGLALLGIGSGGVLVALSTRVRAAATDTIVGACSVVGAVTIPIGYLVIARLPVDTIAIWDYGTRASVKNLAGLGLICFILFATFISLGVIVAVLLGRAGDGLGRIYFADLLGAGAGCFIAIPLISRLGPPAVVATSALVFALVGVLTLARRSWLTAVGAVAAVVLAGAVVARGSLPDIRVESTKIDPAAAEFSEWGPVFRVDVIAAGDPDGRLLAHDGTFGSGIRTFDGDVDALDGYDADPRAIPFAILGDPPTTELIIGSAGGNEILASLAFGATDIDAVELNPVTVGLLRDEYADFTGHLPDRPEVDLTLGDGRSYLARSDTDYDLVWYVAPDSYAANNAASSGAFVLSESYLYTTEMIEVSLEHLSDDGIMVVQFGELDFEASPDRTSRYIVTARDALEAVGVDDPSRHLVVSSFLTEQADLSTIIVKRTPFTEAEVDRLTAVLPDLDGSHLVHAPGAGTSRGIVGQLASGTAAEVDAVVAGHDEDISVVADDAPFFWHFSPFTAVLGDIFRPIRVVDVEDVIGERVLLLLLGFSILMAAVFLLLPFVVVRRRWAALPAKGTSAVYFACLGLGFILFEITSIQRLSRFLGYPTYSLTVTLASILLTTGVGALLSRRLDGREGRALPLLLGALAVLTAFYQLGLDPLTDGLLDQALGVRVVVALLVLAPLGLLLGLFMPLGLAQVNRFTEHRGDGSGGGRQEYVAWAWAVNGFFSVIGSVLTTILSMSYGFRLVQLGALGIYAVAALAFARLRRLPSAGVKHERDPFAKRTADPGILAPWFAELGRNLPGLVRSYLPRGPIDARTRERVILAVTEVNGCRYCAWIHGSWADYLGERVEDPAEAEEALLAYARACAEAGRPLDPAPLRAVLPAEAVAAVRATVAQIEVSNLVGNTVDGLLARLTRKRPIDPPRAALEAATVAAALPLAAPLLGAAAAMRLVERLAPPVPEIEGPPAGEANLLVHLLVRTVPAYLANAGVRALLLRMPVTLSVGIRAGKTAATLRIGRGRVGVVNGIAPDAVVVLEGDVEPLLQLATGTLVRELSTLRLKRD